MATEYFSNVVQPFQVVTRSSVNGTFSGFLFGRQGPLIVALHGFPDTPQTYRFQVEPWLQQGYRVFVPFMRGYESSSVNTEGQYYLTQLAEDVFDWLEYLQQDQVHLVGHDWGALTAWVAVAMAPQRFISVTCIAIPPLGRFLQALLKHPIQLRYSWYIGFFQMVGLSDWLVERDQWQFIRHLWDTWSPGWRYDPAWLEDVIQVLSAPGVKKAALGYYRCLLKPYSEEGRRILRIIKRKIKVPAAVIFGVQDGCMHQSLFESSFREDDFPEGVSLYRIEKAGHFVHLEQPQRINQVTLTHFSRS